jgi:hypothetical protein
MFLSSWSRVRWPLVLTLTLICHLVTVPLIGFSVRSRVAYTRFLLIALVIIAAVLVWRLVTVTFQRARLAAIRKGRSSTRSLVELGERVVKVVVVLVALFVLLALGGVDPGTALAGVGIVGVAVALGAQKSVENLLGAVFLLTDRVLAVGDFCRRIRSRRDGLRTSRCGRYASARWIRRCCRCPRACCHKAASRTTRRAARFFFRLCCGCGMARPASNYTSFWKTCDNSWHSTRRSRKRARVRD